MSFIKKRIKELIVFIFIISLLMLGKFYPETKSITTIIVYGIEIAVLAIALLNLLTVHYLLEKDKKDLLKKLNKASSTTIEYFFKQTILITTMLYVDKPILVVIHLCSLFVWFIFKEALKGEK